MPKLKARSSVCMFQRNHIALNTVIKAESLYQLMYLRFICYKLKLIVEIGAIKMYVITYMIYHIIKLIMLHIYLMRSSNEYWLYVKVYKRKKLIMYNVLTLGLPNIVLPDIYYRTASHIFH